MQSGREKKNPEGGGKNRPVKHTCKVGQVKAIALDQDQLWANFLPKIVNAHTETGVLQNNFPLR